MDAPSASATLSAPLHHARTQVDGAVLNGHERRVERPRRPRVRLGLHNLLCNRARAARWRERERHLAGRADRGGARSASSSRAAADRDVGLARAAGVALAVGAEARRAAPREMPRATAVTKDDAGVHDKASARSSGDGVKTGGDGGGGDDDEDDDGRRHRPAHARPVGPRRFFDAARRHGKAHQRLGLRAAASLQRPRDAGFASDSRRHAVGGRHVLPLPRRPRIGGRAQAVNLGGRGGTANS